LSTEVAQAFDLLGQLIRQVILAIVASQGAKEREIQNVNEIVGCFIKGGIKTVNITINWKPMKRSKKI
jgi:hypothetical protein